MDLGGLLARFQALPASLRIGALLAPLLIVVLASVFAMGTRGSRVALFASALHPEQVAEVQERLAEWNVPFGLSADNVLVDAKRKNEILLRLSLAGVPHAHLETSADLFAKVGALTPQSVIDAQARDGMAADLELALRGIDGVADATIIIAPAKSATFADESAHDATASVRLRMVPGSRLKGSAISGIRSFIAAGVPGLDASRVTILDDRGVALNDQGSQMQDISEVQGSVQTALDSAFGAETTIVRLHADYDGRTQHVHETRRAAASAMPITSDRSDERYFGGDRHYAKSSVTDDRGSDERQVDTAFVPGRVTRLSMAIAVDERHAADLYKIRALASEAAGIDARRGDTVSVQVVHFPARGPAVKRDGWTLAYALISTIAPCLLVVLALLGLAKIFAQPLAGACKAIARRATIAGTQRAVSGFAPVQVRAALRDEPPHTAAAVISALPAATAAAVLELYPPEERAAILTRMAREQSSLLPDYQTVIANA